MRKVGGLYILSADIEFYSEDNKIFYKDETKFVEGNCHQASATMSCPGSGDRVTEIKNNPATDKDLEDLAVWINSPWSQIHEKYEIKLNCKDAYTEMDPNEPAWRCEYSITGYEGIQASVFGYGNTEVEALHDCVCLFKYLQKTYNPDDESC